MAYRMQKEQLQLKCRCNPQNSDKIICPGYEYCGFLCVRVEHGEWDGNGLDWLYKPITKREFLTSEQLGA